ncbi:MAG: hypothetical protein ACE5EK_08960 [Nitrospinales bacterium]
MPDLVAEPPLDTRLLWNMNPNGFLFIGYDLDKNGKADYYSLRVISERFLSKKVIQNEGEKFPGKLVFSTENRLGFSYYIVETQPSLYALDLNEDGTWDVMYKDPMMDGVNGNEIFFGSPSETFLKNQEDLSGHSPR